MTTLAENIECLSAWAQTQEQVQRASWQVQVAGLMHVEQEETLTTEYPEETASSPSSFPHDLVRNTALRG